MNLRDFDYHLPKSLIAQQPVPQRDRSRLMVLDRQTGAIEHRLFSHLPDYLHPGDVLVVNETRVLPALLIGQKESGGKIEALLVRKSGPEAAGESSQEWECLLKSKGKMRGKTRAYFGAGLQGEIVGKTPAGLWRLNFEEKGNLDPIFRRIGHPPLPPYIRRNGDRKMGAMDLERYQTVFARREGAIAAPTAGLHFTETLLNRVRDRGVQIFPLTLHVGIGTFLPVKHQEVEKHRLEPEFFSVPLETACAVNHARALKKRVVAVGTTVTRALESCVGGEGKIIPQQGETGLFILPGYRFRAVDALVSNFHLPRSTLIMLVSAFAGRELTLTAYQEAIRGNYRFYSYGDAMFIK